MDLRPGEFVDIEFNYSKGYGKVVNKSRPNVYSIHVIEFMYWNDCVMDIHEEYLRRQRCAGEKLLLDRLKTGYEDWRFRIYYTLSV